jgi:hypothetical protein
LRTTSSARGLKRLWSTKFGTTSSGPSKLKTSRVCAASQSDTHTIASLFCRPKRITSR